MVIFHSFLYVYQRVTYQAGRSMIAHVKAQISSYVAEVEACVPWPLDPLVQNCTVWSLGFCGSWATGMPAAQPWVSRQGERLWGDRPFGRRFDGTLAEVFSEHPLHWSPLRDNPLVLRRFETLRGAFISLLLASQIFGDNNCSQQTSTDGWWLLEFGRRGICSQWMPHEITTSAARAAQDLPKLFQKARGSVLSCAEHIRQTAWVWYGLIFFGSLYHRIGWWENLQESPIFDGKNHGFL